MCSALHSPTIHTRYQGFPQSLLPNLETHQDWDRSGADINKYHFTEVVPIYKSCKSGPATQLTTLQSMDLPGSLIHVR